MGVMKFCLLVTVLTFVYVSFAKSSHQSQTLYDLLRDAEDQSALGLNPFEPQSELLDDYPSDKRSRTRAKYEDVMKLFRNLAMSRLMKRSQMTKRSGESAEGIGTGVAGMENEGNQEHQLNIPRLNSLQDRSLSPNFRALWKTRVG